MIFCLRNGEASIVSATGNDTAALEAIQKVLDENRIGYTRHDATEGLVLETDSASGAKWYRSALATKQHELYLKYPVTVYARQRILVNALSQDEALAITRESILSSTLDRTIKTFGDGSNEVLDTDFLGRHHDEFHPAMDVRVEEPENIDLPLSPMSVGAEHTPIMAVVFKSKRGETMLYEANPESRSAEAIISDETLSPVAWALVVPSNMGLCSPMEDPIVGDTYHINGPTFRGDAGRIVWMFKIKP